MRSLRSPSRRTDAGSAVVEFVLVAPLLVLLGFAVVQVGLLLHARATMASAADEGARAGALAGADPRAGARRASEVLERNLSGAVIDHVSARRELLDGAHVITVRITATVPLLGLLGATQVEAEGHALAEDVR